MLDNHTSATTGTQDAKKIYQSFCGVAYDRFPRRDGKSKRKSGGNNGRDGGKRQKKGAQKARKFCINHGHCGHATSECRGVKTGSKGSKTSAENAEAKTSKTS